MKILIIEDDITDSVDLRIKLDELGYTDVHIATNMEDCEFHIQQGEIKLAFLDANLGDLGEGLKVADELDKAGIRFVILTKYADEVTYDTFSSNQPFGYYIKPLEFVTLKHLIESINSKGAEVSENIVKSENFTFIRTKSQYLKLSYDDIDYLQAESNYVTIYSVGKRYVIRDSLKRIAEELDSDTFIRIHRKFMVNKGKIMSYNYLDKEIKLADASLPVGRHYKPMLLKLLPTI